MRRLFHKSEGKEGAPRCIHAKGSRARAMKIKWSKLSKGGEGPSTHAFMHAEAFFSLPGNFQHPSIGLRAFRVLRPLRAIAGIPEIRIIVNSLLGSFKMLLDAMSLYFLLMLMFGIMAIQLWKGRLRYRCVDSQGHMLNDAQVLINHLLPPNSRTGCQLNSATVLCLGIHYLFDQITRPYYQGNISRPPM